MRLREYYDVYYYEGVFDLETKRFDSKKYDDAEVVRIFPLEKLIKEKTTINMGMISVKKDRETHVENEEELFDTIPTDNITSNEYIIASQGQQCCL